MAEDKGEESGQDKREKAKEAKEAKEAREDRRKRRPVRRKSILQVLQPTVGLKTSAINFPLALARACDLAVRARGESAFL